MSNHGVTQNQPSAVKIGGNMFKSGPSFGKLPEEPLPSKHVHLELDWSRFNKAVSNLSKQSHNQTPNMSLNDLKNTKSGRAKEAKQRVMDRAQPRLNNRRTSKPSRTSRVNVKFDEEDGDDDDDEMGSSAPLSMAFAHVLPQQSLFPKPATASPSLSPVPSGPDFPSFENFAPLQNSAQLFNTNIALGCTPVNFISSASAFPLFGTSAPQELEDEEMGGVEAGLESTQQLFSGPTRDNEILMPEEEASVDQRHQALETTHNVESEMEDSVSQISLLAPITGAVDQRHQETQPACDVEFEMQDLDSHISQLTPVTEVVDQHYQVVQPARDLESEMQDFGGHISSLAATTEAFDKEIGDIQLEKTLVMAVDRADIKTELTILTDNRDNEGATKMDDSLSTEPSQMPQGMEESSSVINYSEGPYHKVLMFTEDEAVSANEEAIKNEVEEDSKFQTSINENSNIYKVVERFENLKPQSLQTLEEAQAASKEAAYEATESPSFLQSSLSQRAQENEDKKQKRLSKFGPRINAPLTIPSFYPNGASHPFASSLNFKFPTRSKCFSVGGIENSFNTSNTIAPLSRTMSPLSTEEEASSEDRTDTTHIIGDVSLRKEDVFPKGLDGSNLTENTDVIPLEHCHNDMENPPLPIEDVAAKQVQEEKSNICYKPAASESLPGIEKKDHAAPMESNFGDEIPLRKSALKSHPMQQANDKEIMKLLQEKCDEISLLKKENQSLSKKLRLFQKIDEKTRKDAESFRKMSTARPRVPLFPRKTTGRRPEAAMKQEIFAEPLVASNKDASEGQQTTIERDSVETITEPTDANTTLTTSNVLAEQLNASNQYTSEVQQTIAERDAVETITEAAEPTDVNTALKTVLKAKINESELLETIEQQLTTISRLKAEVEAEKNQVVESTKQCEDLKEDHKNMIEALKEDLQKEYRVAIEAIDKENERVQALQKEMIANLDTTIEGLAAEHFKDVDHVEARSKSKYEGIIRVLQECLESVINKGSPATDDSIDEKATNTILIPAAYSHNGLIEYFPITNHVQDSEENRAGSQEVSEAGNALFRTSASNGVRYSPKSFFLSRKLSFFVLFVLLAVGLYNLRVPVSIIHEKGGIVQGFTDSGCTWKDFNPFEPLPTSKLSDAPPQSSEPTKESGSTDPLAIFSASIPEPGVVHAKVGTRDLVDLRKLRASDPMTIYLSCNMGFSIFSYWLPRFGIQILRGVAKWVR